MIENILIFSGGLIVGGLVLIVIVNSAMKTVVAGCLGW